MRGRADPARYRRNRNLHTKKKSNGSSIRIRCTYRDSQGIEAPRRPGKGHKFILSRPDIAPASTSATTLPIINRQEHRVRESTESLSRPA